MARRRKRRPRRFNSCMGKKKYKRWDAVLTAKERSSETGGRYKAYRCIFSCKLEDGSKAWHIGHKTAGL